MFETNKNKIIFGCKAVGEEILEYPSVINSVDYLNNQRFEKTLSYPVITTDIKNSADILIQKLFPNLDRNVLCCNFETFNESVKRNYTPFLHKVCKCKKDYLDINVRPLEELFPNPIDINGITLVADLSRKLSVISINKNFRIFLGIGVSYKTNFSDFQVYSHELGHVFTSRNSYYTDLLVYNEAMSIFLEKLFMYEIDKSELSLNIGQSLIYVNQKELINRTKIFKGDKYIFYSTYIISNFVAEILFCRYYEGNISEKKEILKYVEKVFNGYITLDKMLDDLNIDLRSYEVLYATKNAVKRLKR